MSTSWEPNELASPIRCASPPESVRVPRFIERYVSPTSHRKRTRSRASFRMCSATFCSNGESVSVASHSLRRSTGSSAISAIVRPATFTCRASAWSLVPSQVGQICALWY